MAEKDAAEKTLEWYPDVFADIVNVLLFHGERVVKEADLTEGTPRSVYKADDQMLHEQERDVAKYWNNGTIRIAFYGLENQTEPDQDMPLRLMGYDGVAYRSQLLQDEEKDENGKKRKKVKPRYPVVTLVLYFGYKKPWDKPKNLLKCMNVPEPLLPFVNDYRANIFEIAYLTEEQAAMFTSDFRIVADYFIQKRKNKEYQPPDIEMKHVREILELLRIFERDNTFAEVFRDAKKGGIRTMCDVVENFIQKGLREGREKGREEGREEGLKEGREETLHQNIKNLMVTLKMSAEQAMEALCVPEEERPKYLSLLKK